MLSQSPGDLVQSGRQLLLGFASAIAGTSGRGRFHQRLARYWNLDPDGVDMLRRTLVLVADHELNPSSFAARVSASTGASLPACVLAGLSTLSGPRHGEAAISAVSYLRAALSGAQNTLSDPIPAIGHALYPSGDPRAKALLRWLKPQPDLKRAIRAAERKGGQPANIDMALAALCLQFDMPEDAPFLIFAAGRMVGWIAHAMEQSQSGKMIRPRAKYLGD